MPKSAFAHALDEIQRELKPFLTQRGFKVRGRTFNRLSEDGCTSVVNLQMGAADPPGTTYIPGLRENLHGLFAVNLGVYIPEVARYQGGGEAGSWIQEYNCCVRVRLGALVGEGKEVWWRAVPSQQVIAAVRNALQSEGLPFLERYDTRDKILSEWSGQSRSVAGGSPPRIVLAVILAGRGQVEHARQLLSLQARETRNPGHPAHVRELAHKLGLRELKG